MLTFRMFHQKMGLFSNNGGSAAAPHLGNSVFRINDMHNISAVILEADGGNIGTH